MEGYRQNVRIDVILCDNVLEYHDLGILGLQTTKSNDVFCLGGGIILKNEFLSLLNTNTKNDNNCDLNWQLTFHIFDISRIIPKINSNDEIHEKCALINYKPDKIHPFLKIKRYIAKTVHHVIDEYVSDENDKDRHDSYQIHLENEN